MRSQLAYVVTSTVLAGVLVAASGPGAADDKQKSGRGPAAAKEKVSGVILSLQPVAGEQGGKRAWKMTVNTDVIWRDFVRDQATAPRKAAATGTDRAARKGREGVAAEGHPRDDDLVVAVDFEPSTEISLRYRSSTDAIGEGSPTAEGAARAEEAATTSEAPRPGTARQAPKVRVLDPGELKPGLWVDIEFGKAGQINRARRIIVLRPVGGPDTPAARKPATTVTPGR